MAIEDTWEWNMDAERAYQETVERGGPVSDAMLQIPNIAQLLDGKRVEFPRFAADVTFKKAPKARKAAEEQIPLGNGEIEEPF